MAKNPSSMMMKFGFVPIATSTSWTWTKLCAVTVKPNATNVWKSKRCWLILCNFKYM